jgi:hypothetical protein
MQFTLVGETQKMEFRDSSARGEAAPIKYAVGLYNRETGRLKIAETPFLFRLQQKIKGLKTSESFGKEVSLAIFAWWRTTF